MSAQNPRSSVASRRGELLAELLLQEFGPLFISRPTSGDLGYDFLVGFKNDKDGINTFTIEVRATEQPPGPRFAIPRRIFNRIAHSNIPSLLLVADVKQNHLHYAWLHAHNGDETRNSVSIPLVELNDQAKKKLEDELKSADVHCGIPA